MKCIYCGAEMESGSRFCSECGKPLLQDEMQSKPRKPVQKGVVAALVVLCLLIGAGGAGIYLYLNRKVPVDISEYTVVSFAGIEPEGEAIVAIDYDKMHGDLDGKLNIPMTRSDKLAARQNGMSDDSYLADKKAHACEDIVEECVETQFDKSEGLSKGDEVKLTFKLDQDKAAKFYNINLTGSSMTVKVDKLDAYVTKCSQIDSDGLKSLKKDAEDIITSNFAEEESAEINKKSYIGSYVKVPKTSDGNTNSVILVYKLRGTGKGNNFFSDDEFTVTTDFYYYVAFDNVILDSQGKLQYDPQLSTTPSQYFNAEDETTGGYVTINGYEMLKDLQKDVVDAHVDDYVFDADIDQNAAKSDQKKEKAKSEAANRTYDDSDDDEDSVSRDESMSGEYVALFPDSSERRLTDGEISSLSSQGARKAINEIYARNHRIFDNDDLNEYFGQEFDLWISKDEFDENEDEYISSIEKDNIKRLAARRDR